MVFTVPSGFCTYTKCFTSTVVGLVGFSYFYSVLSGCTGCFRFHCISQFAVQSAEMHRTELQDEGQYLGKTSAAAPVITFLFLWLLFPRVATYSHADGDSQLIPTEKADLPMHMLCR